MISWLWLIPASLLAGYAGYKLNEAERDMQCERCSHDTAAAVGRMLERSDNNAV